jgi:hypothetical protein
LFFDYDHNWGLREKVINDLELSSFENELEIPPFHQNKPFGLG